MALSMVGAASQSKVRTKALQQTFGKERGT